MAGRPRRQGAPRHAQRSWLLLAIALAVLAPLAWRAWRLSTPLETLLAQARQALADKRYGEVEMLCQCVLARDSGSSQALLLAGEAAMKQGRADAAVDYYHRVGPEDPALAAVAALAAGDVLLHANRATAAERDLRAALGADPALAAARERLVWLLGVEGRRFEALPHVYALLRQNRFTVELLLAAGNHDVAFQERPRLEAFLRAEPDDELPLIGLARIALRTDCAEARRLVERVVEEYPEQVEAHALLGRALWELDDQEALGRWQANLPAAADEHPDIWLVRGYLAERAGDPTAAARLFWEALRRDGNHQAATYQLLRALTSLSAAASPPADDAVPFLGERARQLEELAETLDRFYARGKDMAGFAPLRWCGESCCARRRE